MSDMPEVVWLQLDDDHLLSTWCADRVNDDDVKYARVPQWISVEERLPDEKKEVLTLTPIFSLDGFHWRANVQWLQEGIWYPFEDSLKPLYWQKIMPLPDAPG